MRMLIALVRFLLVEACRYFSNLCLPIWWANQAES